MFYCVCCVYCVYCCFFKQKTAYDMRISDWSSDVCSSDLRHDNNVLVGAKVKIDGSGDRRFKQSLIRYLRKQIGPGKIEKVKFANSRSDNLIQLADMCVGAIARSYRPDIRKDANRWHKMLIDKIERSEEHTSELQSLMRISYAVFCLKK